MSDSSLCLGIWDGHDAGAAIVQGNTILFAINEERLSRRKLEIGFPQRSIIESLRYMSLDPKQITKVAVSTSDFAKTLSRLFPSLQENYYQVRRRKKTPGLLSPIKKLIKYPLTEIPPSNLTRKLSADVIQQKLARLGIAAPVTFVDHHTCHAAGALFSSGFDTATVVTLDGIGDGLSGTIWSYDSTGASSASTSASISDSSGSTHPLRLLQKISGRHSLGIFFEHVTNLLHMRELEDEGKVMALANFTFPVDDRDNPLLDLFTVDGLNIRCKHNSLMLYKKLSDIYYCLPSEQFALFAQKTMEIKVLELIKNALQKTGFKRLVLSGGVAANVKVNMLVNDLPALEDLFVFPHMGDGGLASGAALWSNYEDYRITPTTLPNAYLGNDFSREEIMRALSQHENLRYTEEERIAPVVAKLLADGEIVLWATGRMEYGPRSLGARSILALPNSIDIKNDLNLKLKKRAWYQPFCPSMLAEDAAIVLENLKTTPNAFMTCAYRVKPAYRSQLQGVINIDGTCRPQLVVKRENDKYRELLEHIQELTGLGVILNTSFNHHGEPIVCSPHDAIKSFLGTEVKHLVLNDFLVSKR